MGGLKPHCFYFEANLFLQCTQSARQLYTWIAWLRTCLSSFTTLKCVNVGFFELLVKTSVNAKSHDKAVTKPRACKLHSTVGAATLFDYQTSLQENKFKSLYALFNDAASYGGVAPRTLHVS